MSGIFGGAKKDRQQQLASRTDLNNVYNYALPESKGGQSAGAAGLGDASAYFRNLLRSTRSDVEQQSAPAINANLEGYDAIKRSEGTMGTSRTGGTAELNRTGSADVAGRNADIVNNTLQVNKQVGSQGLMESSEAQLRNALALLGLGQDSVDKVLNDATKSRSATQSLWGNILTAGTNSIIGGAAGDVSTGLKAIFK